LYAQYKKKAIRNVPRDSDGLTLEKTGDIVPSEHNSEEQRVP